MKKEVISFLSTIKKDIFNISKYLYENPEESYKESKSSTFITNFLSENKFTVKIPFLEIDTAFYASFGEGHPKICFLCEYDAVPNKGHITGHNLVSAISIASALALSKVIKSTGGSVILIGCPGEFKTGSKVTMAKQGVFDDIDVVMMAHPDTITAESGTSKAVIPLKINYKTEEGFAYRNKNNGCSALDATILTFSIINQMSNCFNEEASIDKILLKGGDMPYFLPSFTDSRIYIRAKSMSYAEEIEKKIREVVKTISYVLEVEGTSTLFELPYEELYTNKSLSRIFCHNLKESGIIEVNPPKNTNSGLSIGSISHKVPCLHPYIAITNNPCVKYATDAFAKATLSDFAQDSALKTAQAFALTSLDLIEKEALLKEVKKDTYIQL